MFSFIKRLLKYLLILVVIYQGWILSNVFYYRYFPPKQTSVMGAELNRLRINTPDAELKYTWVSYQNISPYIKQAVITSEDAKFLIHSGADFEAMKNAFEHNAQSNRIRGGSTITQQVAKNLFLSNKRSYLRKGEELIIAYMLETTMDKQRILELYLNIAEWGEGIFGIEAAAQHYYGISASALNAQQSAKLAAMLPRPRFYQKNQNSSYLKKRTYNILRYLNQATIP